MVKKTFLACFVAFYCVLLAGCDDLKHSKLSFTTPYQAVMLTTGQVFVGRIEKQGSQFITLKDVYYIQSAMDPATKQVKHSLIKRGKEAHGPDLTHINMQHILIIEPVTADSKVSQLIKESARQ